MSPPAGLRCAGPCAFVVFGALGDLTRRKLLPALYNLARNGLLPREFAFIGVARAAMDDEAFRDHATKALRECSTQGVDEALLRDLAERTHYVRGDFGDPQTYRGVADALAAAARSHGTGGNAVFYLATPPSAFAPIVEGLGATGLAAQQAGWRRVVVEKPFGRDLASAIALNRDLTRVLDESQVFRIDHYLGKETVQNLMVFRFANGLLEPVWNRRYVDHVQVTVAESIGVEGRGNYYEKAGALRDILQNHMLQLLALVAMEPPATLAPEAVRNEKVKVLEAIRSMPPEQVLRDTVRGQYRGGTVKDREVPAYRQEPNVAPDSQVETFAALKLQIENWRWAGVPFYLRTGKRLAKRDTQISLQFRRPPLLLFEQAGIEEQIERNRLDIHIQPDEGISIWVKAKRPGPVMTLQPVKLEFSYSQFGERQPTTGYERLLHDVMMGDSSLFLRADFVEQSWRIVTSVLDVWATLPARDFPNYDAGSWGPQAAAELIGRDGRRWITPE